MFGSFGFPIIAEFYQKHFVNSQNMVETDFVG
jgi:hypothetical protein